MSRAEQNTRIFWSSGKDTITTMDFIRRLEHLAKTNKWIDTHILSLCQHAQKSSYKMALLDGGHGQ
jgi:hypothetical protein